jgi:hypothetical protein
VTADQKARLYSLLLKLAAEDLAVQVDRMADVRRLPVEVRDEIADVLGHEAALRGFDRYDRRTRYGEELGGLIKALGLVAD